MIGGVIMILVAVWLYQSALKAKTNNLLLWVAVGAITFFVVQLLMVEVNVYLLESIRSGETSVSYEGVDGADRKNIGGFQGFGGILESLFFELFPPFAGIVAAGLIRVKFITKEAISVTTIFGGLKELFQGIKESFKTPEK
ncbi:MAG: hypothetical protein PHC94_04760 [Methylobacter sp.]|jgi:hypothetical protein|nr:hypothetical protein [Methylobacter sp.]